VLVVKLFMALFMPEVEVVEVLKVAQVPEILPQLL
jgi:hypothetical protein